MPQDSVLLGQNETGQKRELTYIEILISASIILFCVCIFFWEPIISGSTVLPAANVFEHPFYRPYAPEGFTGPPNSVLFDQSSCFYPLQHFATQSLRDLKLHLWNPHILLGMPTLGSAQAALLYPINLLGIFLPHLTIILIKSIFNLWCAGFFTYILMRRLGVKSIEAFLSAIAFMFGGFIVLWLGHPHSNAAIWLPAMILMAELIATSHHKRGFYASVSGFLIALSFLGGHMQTTFEITFAWSLYLIVRSFQIGGWQWLIKNLYVAVLSVVLGLSAAAVQIIPFLEWLERSAILKDRSAAHFTPFFQDFWRYCLTLPTLIVPNLYNNPSQTSFYQSYLPWTNFNEISSGYVGIIPLVLGLFALSLSKHENKYARLFAGGAFVFLALALRLPLIDWINQLPLFKLIAPGRYRLIFVLGISVAAGLTLNSWLKNSYNPMCWQKLSWILLLLGGIILAAVLSMGLVLPAMEKPILAYGRGFVEAEYVKSTVRSRSLSEVLPLVDRIYQDLIKHFSIANWKLYFPGVVACLGGLWIIVWQRAWFGKTVFKYGIVFLVLIDLLVFGMGYNPSIRPELVYPDTPPVRVLKQDNSLFRILPARMEWISNGPLAHGLSEVGGYDLQTKYYHDFRNLIAESYPFNLGDITMFAAQSANSRLMDLVNVKYIVTTKKMDDSFRRDIQPIWQENGIYIYKNYAAMPRAFMVSRARCLTDDAILKTLRDPSFDPAAEVLLSVPQGEGITMSTASSNKDHVEMIKYEPERVQITVIAGDDRILVLSDAYYPGWHAYMDGTEIPIYRANYVMRAVSIAKGHHDIEFRYEPLSVFWGVVISLSAIILMTIISIVSLWKFKKSKGPIIRHSAF